MHLDSQSPRPMRAINVSNAFASKGHNVHIISAAFYHQQKKHRNVSGIVHYSSHISYQLVSSPGYSSNIGLARFADHFVLAISLFRALISLRYSPDAFFIGYPPIECSLVAVIWAKLRGIPSFLDVKDTWPNMFVDYFPFSFKWLIRLCILPYSLPAFISFRMADYVVTITSSYLDWICRYSKKNRSDLNSFILPLIPPAELAATKSVTQSTSLYCNQILAHMPRDLPIFCFIGSLTASFDFKCLHQAAFMLNQSHNFLLVIAGAGAEENAIKNLFVDIPNAVFPGWLDYADVKLLLTKSICLVAPYRSIDNFTMNIPNKIVDSLALKTTFLTSLDGEVRKLADDHKCGLVCIDTPESWMESMKLLIEQPGLVEELSSNSYNYYLSHFTHKATYGAFVDYLSSAIHAD